MVGGGGVDTFDGGPDFDTILFRGTTGNDIITANQVADGAVATTLNGVLDTDVLVLVAGVRTVERFKIEALAGDDVIIVQHVDSLGVDALVNSVLFDIDGGEALTRDRLSVQDSPIGDLLLYRKAEFDHAGSISVGPSNAEPLENVFQNVEFIQPIAAVGGQVLVFKHDPFEFNDANPIVLVHNLTFERSGERDPSGRRWRDQYRSHDRSRSLPGRSGRLHAVAGRFRLVSRRGQAHRHAGLPGLLRGVPTVLSGRPGLPGNGDLNIELYDVDGTLIAGGGPLFGGNNGTGLNPELDVDGDLFAENERIRIPAVQGQVYYLRVFGAPPALGGPSLAINNYTMTILNEPAPVPFDLELHDFIFPGTVTAGVSNTVFNGNANLPAVDDFFNGKVVMFNFDTLTPGLRLREATVLDYVGATRTFILLPPLPAVPVAGNTFQVESIDTGRNNLDNTTRDNTPTIVFRLDDAFFLNDLPGNDVTDTPPDEVIPIPFIPGPLFGLAGFTTGYRIAIFDEGTTPGGPTVTPPQTPLGFATFAGDLNENGVLDAGEVFQPGVYQFTTPVAGRRQPLHYGPRADDRSVQYGRRSDGCGHPADDGLRRTQPLAWRSWSTRCSRRSPSATRQMPTTA